MRLAIVLVAACGSHAPSVVTGQFPPRTVDPDAIRRACAMEVSCFAMPPLTPGGQCVTMFEAGLANGAGLFFGPSADDIERYVACASLATDCATALACASRDHDPTYCNAHPGQSCDGDIAVGCQGGWGVELVDCAARGQHCAQGVDSAICTNGRSCSASAPDRCDGDNVVVRCNSLGLETTVDCAAFGETCAYGSCIATDALNACSGVDGCDGSDMRLCGTDGLEHRVACSSFASHCELVPNVQTSRLECVPDATECTSLTRDTCNGDALRMCVNGAFVDTPCSSIGLTTCANGACR